MRLKKLGATGLDVAQLVLGGNVFGWTADRDTSFAILDAYLEAGGNAVDTADVYNRFAPGGKGGESETVIGEWMKDRGVRKRIVVITKGGLPMGENMQGLGRDYLVKACEASLKRMQTDYVDVYMSHRPDPTVPIEETMETYQKLIDAGKVRFAGNSNYSAEELTQADAIAGNGRARYTVAEPHYNLVQRKEYEGPVEEFCAKHGLGVIPYFSLAAGFLTGKYRSEKDLDGKARKSTAASYMTPHGLKVLDVVETVAVRHGVTLAQVALAWLMARPSVTAPIASATNLGQLADILKSTSLTLTPEDLASLNV